ncbi:MAG: methyltransferase domain-containing protein [Dehalococcoidia bacterium]
MIDPWNPELYGRFGADRSRPFWDLVALIRPRTGMRIVDLGCGAGGLTLALHEHLQASETVGIDSSPTMLATSAANVRRGVRFAEAHIERFEERGAFDLVFSNASLQFVGDHVTLFARLVAALKPGGQLAIHVPANHEHVSQTIAAGVAGEEPFRSELGGFVRSSPVLRPEQYAVLLHRLGVSEQIVRLQVYGNLLASRDDVVDWVKGGALTDYQKRLAPESFERFVERYRELLVARLDDERPYFFPFNRILIWAVR